MYYFLAYFVIHSLRGLFSISVIACYFTKFHVVKYSFFLKTLSQALHNSTLKGCKTLNFSEESGLKHVTSKVQKVFFTSNAILIGLVQIVHRLLENELHEKFFQSFNEIHLLGRIRHYIRTS